MNNKLLYNHFISKYLNFLKFKTKNSPLNFKNYCFFQYYLYRIKINHKNIVKFLL